MFFWILILAHEIADFPLQFDTIYRLKRTSHWGVLPHILICTAINIIIFAPFLFTAKIWYAILFLSLVHFLLDKSKVSIFSKGTGDNFLNFFIDQLLHIISIWLTALWLSLNVDLNSFTLPNFYYHTPFLIASSVLIFSMFGGTPIVHYANHFWHLKKKSKTPSYPSGKERFPGILERGIATMAIIMGGWIILFAPLAFLPHYLLNKNKSAHVKSVKALTGIAVSIICGIIYSLAIHY